MGTFARMNDFLTTGFAVVIHDFTPLFLLLELSIKQEVYNKTDYKRPGFFKPPNSRLDASLSSAFSAIS